MSYLDRIMRPEADLVAEAPRTEPQPKRGDPPLALALDRLGALLGKMTAAVAQLEDRLAPVTLSKARPERPTPSQREPMSPVPTTLHDFVDRLELVLDRLGALLAELEV
jgi:hypothetical protein